MINYEIIDNDGKYCGYFEMGDFHYDTDWYFNEEYAIVELYGFLSGLKIHFDAAYEELKKQQEKFRKS